MNTIDTIEDLIDVLDRNPRWMEAVRSRILTRELLELPARFAELIERFDKFREEMSGFISVTNRRLQALEEKTGGLVASTGRLEEKTDDLATRTGRLETKTDDLAASTGRLEEKTDGLAASTGRLEEKTDDLATRTGRLETKTDRMLDDLGYLKGTHARNAAVEDAPSIARSLGLHYTKTLTRSDLWDIIDGADTTAIDSGTVLSFRNADLIMEAVDAAGETCYVVVEISFTANGRDTRRALRNADFLTRFTGRTSHAVVSGLKQDDRIKDVIESGAVSWYQLDPGMMEAE